MAEQNEPWWVGNLRAYVDTPDESDGELIDLGSVPETARAALAELEHLRRVARSRVTTPEPGSTLWVHANAELVRLRAIESAARAVVGSPGLGLTPRHDDLRTLRDALEAT